MQLFYSPNITENTPSFTFEKDESRHIAKVLRKSIGDTLYITNGKGWLFTAQITVPNSNKCSVKIISKNTTAKAWLQPAFGRCSNKNERPLRMVFRKSYRNWYR